MRYHITYTKRDGTTEVGRVNAPDRGRAISAAAVTFNVNRSAIRSAVALPEPRPAAPAANTRLCWHCSGSGKAAPGHRCWWCHGSGRTR